jgi:hypothetical protein
VCVYVHGCQQEGANVASVFLGAFEEVTIGKKKDISEIIIILSLLCIFLP